MNSVIPPLGTVGIAVFLTVVLVFGTKESGGGKAKPLGWWWVLILSMLAGASYTAAGWPFDIVPKLIMGDGVGTIGAIMPGLTLPAIALSLMAFLAWVGLSRRQVAVTGIVLVYILAGAGGGLGTLAQRINDIVTNLAS